MSVCATCRETSIRDYSQHNCPGRQASEAAHALLAAFDEIQLAEMHAAASARIKRVRQLHRDWEADPGHCAHCQVADGNLVPYPCPTIRALDGQEQPGA
jgi:hypothetical protein